jgi:SagB-type dehydrogenase family enzyme
VDHFPSGASKQFIKVFGKPPHHFHKIAKSLDTYALPLVRCQDGLYELLLSRKTARVFDPNAPLAIEDLSTILYYVFGCQGYCRVGKEFVGLKKTSPSGGDLHPIEVYPLIVNVAGLRSGTYHYEVEHHSLQLMEEMTQREATTTAALFTAGQRYFGSASVLFVMTARFYRNFWKYRRNGKTYSVVLMDAAHLSQTFYLVCTQLRLGAFITAAINGIISKTGSDSMGLQKGRSQSWAAARERTRLVAWSQNSLRTCQARLR